MDPRPFFHSRYNNLADKAAKEATTIATDTILPISISGTIQVINNTIRDAPPTHKRVVAVYHQRVYGYHQGSLEWLATRPGDVVAYARKTLVNLDA